MEKKFHFGAVEVPEELRENLWAAHNAMLEKKAHIYRLKQGKRDIEAEIAAAETELKEAQTSHVASFAEIAEGASAVSDAGKLAKAKIGEISSRIIGLKDTLPDFATAIRDAQGDMKTLRHEKQSARREIVSVFLRQVPKQSTGLGELNTLGEFIADGGVIDLDTAMLLYLAAHDSFGTDGTGPFPHDGVNPSRFFNFLSKFFRSPDDAEAGAFRSRFDATIWGDDEPPEAVPMPKEHHTDELGAGVDFDATNLI